MITSHELGITVRGVVLRAAFVFLMTAGLAAALVISAGARGAGNEGPRLLVVDHGETQIAALEASDADVVAEYGSFTVVEAGPDDAARLSDAGADLRDDMKTVIIGSDAVDPAEHSLSGWPGADGGPGLAVVQFIGPIKGE